MAGKISEQDISLVARKLLEKTREEADKPKDAVKLLKADHDEALDLYDQFFDAESPTEKQELATKLCIALSVHMRIEEDIFYPAVKRAIQASEKAEREDQMIVPEAKLEHESLKKLVSEVEACPSGVDFDAHVQVMCEYTKHHAKEEEKKMFPQAKDCDLDLDDLGRQLLASKLNLLERLAQGSGEEGLPSALFDLPYRNIRAGIEGRP
jgi:hemerythrin HHE cation binding domain-containing protein